MSNTAGRAVARNGAFIMRGSRPLIAALLLSGAAICTAQETGSRIEAPAAWPMFFEHSDAHAILFLRQHPRYESIEVMASRGQPERTRVILTRHDQSQQDYVGDAALAERLAGVVTGRALHHVPIDVQWVEGRRPGLRVALSDEHGERIEMSVRAASAPDEKYGRLIDPGDHAANSSLALMAMRRASLAATDSMVSFGGIPAQVALKIDTPFFKALEGYYSEDFSLGGLRAAATQELTGLPGPEPISTLTRSQRSTDGSVRGLWLEFAPPLPLDASHWQGRFAMGFEPGEPLVQGPARLTAHGGERRLAMEPQAPGWAARRPVTLTLQSRAGRWLIESSVGGSSTELTSRER